MDKNRDSDAIYKKIKQVIKDDGSMELNVDSPGTRLLGSLALLTQERFLEQIGPFMTPERAKYVRKLRVDDDLTWRGVAEAWEKEFATIAPWKFKGSQLAGMAICELAAKCFGEDYMKPPWN